MLKSLNECTPQEMLALKASELKEAIRLSEFYTWIRTTPANHIFRGLYQKIQKTMNHSETFKFKSEKDGRREKFGLW